MPVTVLHSRKTWNSQQKLWDVHYLLHLICALPQGFWDISPELPNTMWVAERMFWNRHWTEQWEHSVVTKFSALVFLCKIMLLSFPVGVSSHCFRYSDLWSCSFSHIALNYEDLIFFSHLYFQIQIRLTNSLASYLLFKSLHFPC